MTNNELISRYIYAVTKELPRSMREDVEKELSVLISDMLEERCGDIIPTEADVKVVLTELGTPNELAAKYDPKGERYLIGPKYFRKYIRILPIVLGAVALGTTVAGIISVVAGESSGTWYSVLGEWIANIMSSLYGAFSILTIIFAIFEYKKISLDSRDDIANLPPAPVKSERISRGECIIGIIINVLIITLFAFAPQAIIGYASISSGDVVSAIKIPLFNTEVLRSLWLVWGAGLLAGIVNKIVKLTVGRYNISVAIANTVCNAVIAVTFVIFWTNREIINPDFSNACVELGRQENVDAFAVNILTHFPTFILVVFLVIIAIDTVNALVKGIRYGKRQKI